MKRLLAAVLATGDRVNPVAVKEFRQAVQSRWVIAVLMLFLLVNLAVIGGYLALSPDAATSITGGREVFMMLLGFLMVTCFGFVPLYGGIRLALERNDTNLDLFFVTTITPGAIIRGKYLAAMGLTSLIFSACMPFMILTYLLRGIDLPTIFFILAFEFAACAAANAMGIFAGSVSGSWFIRGLVGAGVLFCLFYFGVVMTAMPVTYLNFGMVLMGGTTMWPSLFRSLLFAAMVIGLFYVMATAFLSPKTSNRMLVPRLYITGSWAAYGVVMLIWSLSEKSLAPAGAWMVASGISFIALMVAALSERDAWSARVQRTIPRNPLLRLAAFVFYTGSAGGVAWCVLMFAATMSLTVAWAALAQGFADRADFPDIIYNMIMVFGYALCYCLTIACLRPTLLKKVPTINLPVLAALFAMAVCLVPYFIAFFCERNWWSKLPWYLLGSPVVLTMTDQAAKSAAEKVVLAWLGLCLLLSSPWVIAQWRRFRPYSSSTVYH